MKEFTKEQMTLWGQVNMVVGCVAITSVHMIMLLLGTPPLDWIWQGILLIILVPVGYLYYRQYKQTKEIEETTVLCWDCGCTTTIEGDNISIDDTIYCDICKRSLPVILIVKPKEKDE